MSLTQIYARLNDENACYWSILIRFGVLSIYAYSSG